MNKFTNWNIQKPNAIWMLHPITVNVDLDYINYVFLIKQSEVNDAYIYSKKKTCSCYLYVKPQIRWIQKVSFIQHASLHTDLIYVIIFCVFTMSITWIGMLVVGLRLIYPLMMAALKKFIREPVWLKVQ